MNMRWLLAIFVTFFIIAQVSADFWFNPPAVEIKAKFDLKCVPGRTVMKITEDQSPLNMPNRTDSESDEQFMNTRRKHANLPTKDESCQICVCSASGLFEYCRNRPAINVNECIMIKEQMDKLAKNLPMDHSNSLYGRIRRGLLLQAEVKCGKLATCVVEDYIWHNDEIPYKPTAKCYRAHSYYSNDPKANDSTIEQAQESNLEYQNTSTCYYCVCSVDGTNAGCIHRNVWFCDYMRFLNEKDAVRDMYRHLFKQDRATYFRQISWRMRRAMDDTMFEFISAGGDSLCCNHQDGHRRQIHNGVRSKLRTLKRRIPKENLLGGPMRGDYVDFVVNND